MVQITINGVSIDPELQSQAMNVSGLISADSSHSNYILVQTIQPLNSEQKSQLTGLGAEILEFVPENTYICRYNPENLDAVRNLPFVDWANIYLEGFKIAPRLRDSSVNSNRGNLLALESPKRRMTRQAQPITIVFHNNITLDERLRSRIATAARLNAEELPLNTKSLRLFVQPQYLDDLAKIDEVRHIEEYVAPQLCDNVAVKVINAESTHAIAKFEGEGQVVAVADTGFDKGSTEDVHPAFTGRVLKLYPLGQRRAADPDGHGTHVCGSVLGDGVSESMGGPVRGTAPKAKLVVQSLLDPAGGLGGIPDDLNTLFKEPYENDGARVHSNSWGASTRGAYNILCNQLDQFVWEHRDMVICFAAGNDGRDKDMNGVIDTGSVGAPATAKNCISVGASENNRPEQSQPYKRLQRYKAEPIASDGWSDNPEGIAAFSSRGPTQNERIKPDVVAPGTAILSAYSREAKIDPMFGKSDDPLYAFLAGTSMATPLVSGCAAVVREYLQKQENQQQPSAALVKALLINGAKDLAGQYVPSDAGDIPNFSEGFGRVDLAASTSPRCEKDRVIFQDEKTALDTQQEEKIEVEIAEGESTLKVTLVWTDYPGEALQNDLDLIIKTADGQERHGNVAPTSSEFDRRNNVEQIIWNNLSPGKVEIIVHAYRILHPQSYALVVRVS